MLGVVRKALELFDGKVDRLVQNEAAIRDGWLIVLG